MKGIVLAGDSGQRLHPLTLGVPKQLLPIYDKPMIHYPIETLVGAGIKDILIITSPKYSANFVSALGDGLVFGANFSYSIQSSPDGAAQAFTIAEEYLDKSPVCMITGDCIIIGDDRDEKLRKAIRAARNSGQATIFLSKEYDPNQYGVATLNQKGKCEEIKESADNRRDYSITGLYVFPKGVSEFAKLIEKSERGRYEVTSLNQIYLQENKLQVQILGDNYKWFDTNSIDNLLIASNFIKNQRKVIK